MVGQHDGRREQRAEGERLPEQRRGNAEIAQCERTKEPHQSNAEMKKEGHNHRWNYCGCRARQGQKQSDQRGRHKNRQQRQDEDIHRQSEDGDAMEVESHRQGHGQLDNAGDNQQFVEAK
jgi:hypothetical protein